MRRSTGSSSTESSGDISPLANSSEIRVASTTSINEDDIYSPSTGISHQPSRITSSGRDSLLRSSQILKSQESFGNANNNFVLDIDNVFQEDTSKKSLQTMRHRHSNRDRNSLLRFRTQTVLEKGNQKDNQTIEDAFRKVARGVEAENGKRYKEALIYYMEGGEILSSAAENEKSNHIQDLLLHKAYEVLEWAESLTAWMETDMLTSPPKRNAQTVSINVMGKKPGSTEFDVMHYTPVTSKSPTSFTDDGFKLQCIQEGRSPSLLIVITMYNEDASELGSTLRKCCNNIQYLTDRSLPGYEGEDAWKNVLVCIVSDGRKKADHSTLEYLHTIGLFDENVMNISSTGLDVQLHMFERVVNLNKTRKKKQDKKFPPLQLVFGLKEHNSGKLNSHLWYFNAFCYQVHPEYTGLLDVGTMPTKSAFYRLLKNMEINRQIGGVCGEIAVDKPIPNLFNLVISAQHYEYKVSNVLDKSMESCFGYISVLPGAFSAYRYEAIKGAPLDAYFKSLTVPMSELGPFQGNMYLAEDRILAFEVLAKKNCNWTMHYVKDAIARTDVPTNLTNLIGQRRRWLNGSFFAMLFGIIQWYRVYTESGHSFVRKLAFTIQYSYMVIQTMLNWFLPSAFYLAIYYVCVAGFTDDQWGFISLKDVSKGYKDLFSAIFNSTYGSCMLIQLVYGMGNKPKHLQRTYTITAVYFAIVMAFAFITAVLIFVAVDRYTNFQLFFASAILGVYFVASLLHCEIHHICFTFIQYTLMLPTFINVLMVYSFCNLHDLSWGTKGIDSGEGHSTLSEVGEEKGTYDDIILRRKAAEAKAKKEAEEADTLKRRFDSFRSNLLLLWIFCNSGAVGGCIYFVSADQFLPILYFVVGFFNLFRMIGSFAYLIYVVRQWLVFQCFLRCGILSKRYERKKKVREDFSKSVVFDASCMSPQTMSSTQANFSIL